MSLLPVFLNLRGERAVVIGGGAVALRRTRTLLDAGLLVTVVAPEVCAGLLVLPVRLERRPYQEGDLIGARLVIAATDDSDINAAITAEGHRRGILINHAGEAEAGNLRFAATAGRAGVQVAVSSGRELPMLGQALTRRIAELLPTQAQMDGWALARECALTLDGPAREAAMQELKADISAALDSNLRQDSPLDLPVAVGGAA
ncbi:precorrin-2 dehydrogenase/sirohydrochlorin ferrochelatase family protein [Deinococcus arenicola]|uniref:precorrin-2 dehydrogenase n=1 Tax=Deinococcus arenicola TaxID=2994950 RepID=A0ABU4DRW1_9DEIO|nr:bifunctional precorrin-2 dehydrogenase/sirohydrochlorin ferrochelatase [Deinococcus sp. ZS9-10]MDV6375168.1 bifunctional precorrin-2 dehydrogenase/sirohydrochlorin ferrochelatase [Deinococcus sp. ZS9-10]